MITAVLPTLKKTVYSSTQCCILCIVQVYPCVCHRMVIIMTSITVYLFISHLPSIIATIIPTRMSLVTLVVSHVLIC